MYVVCGCGCVYVCMYIFMYRINVTRRKQSGISLAASCIHTYIHTYSKRFSIAGHGDARFIGQVTDFLLACPPHREKDLYVVRYEDQEEEDLEVICMCVYVCMHVCMYVYNICVSVSACVYAYISYMRRTPMP